MAVAKKLKLRLFLEGVEVPVISANVSISVNAPATASIQILPLDEAAAFRPRTMVHLFYLDSRPNLKQGGMNDTWRLMFAGEMVGFAVVQRADQRGFILNCLDFTSYWDTAHATAIEFGPGGNVFTHSASVYGASTSMFDDIANQQAERISKWIRQKPLTPGLTSVNGLAGGVIRMAEAMGGVTGHEKGVNDFFTVAELRGRLLAQIAAEENDNTAARIMHSQVFNEWLLNGLQNVGQQVTLREMMLLLFRYIYYDFVPNPIARYTRPVKGQKIEGATHKIPINQMPSVQAAVKTLTTLRERLSAFLSKTGDEYRIVAESGVRDLKKDVISPLLKIDADPARWAANAAGGAATMLTSLVEKKPEWERMSYTFPLAIKRIDTALTEIRDGLSITTSYKDADGSSTTMARLRSVIIRPDCFFAAPPRCNVIFPEHYVVFNYDRMFMGEVTRSFIMINNTLVGQDKMFATMILAPKMTAEAKELAKKIGVHQYRYLMDHERHTGIVPKMEWIPNTISSDPKRYDKNSSDFNKEENTIRHAKLQYGDRIAMFHFFKYRYASRGMQVSGRFNPNVVCGFPALVISRPFYLPESTDSLTGDQKIARAQTPELTDSAPNHYIGMVGQVNHNIDQGGGTTSVSMGYSRIHSGNDDDFMKMVVKSVKVKRPITINVVLEYDKLKDNPVQNGKNLLSILVNVTPQKWSTNKKKVTTSSSKAKTSTKPKAERDPRSNEAAASTTVNSSVEGDVTVNSDPILITDLPAVSKYNVMVPNPPGNLVKGKAGVHGTIMEVEVLDSSPKTVASGPFKGAKVYPKVILYETVEVSVDTPIPIEEIMRPTWMSPKYAPSEVGKNIYQPFFGCGSILDGINFSGLAKETLSVPPPAPSDGNPALESESKEELLTRLAEDETARSSMSIEKAANVISYLYGLVKKTSGDVDEFIEDFTYRPIATKQDIMGSDDLKIELQADGTVKKLQGEFGFHTMSIHPALASKGELAGLMADPELGMQRINYTDGRSPISPTYDVRPEKYERVLKYSQALSKSRAFKG